MVGISYGNFVTATGIFERRIVGVYGKGYVVRVANSIFLFEAFISSVWFSNGNVVYFGFRKDRRIFLISREDGGLLIVV